MIGACYLHISFSKNFKIEEIPIKFYVPHCTLYNLYTLCYQGCSIKVHFIMGNKLNMLHLNISKQKQDKPTMKYKGGWLKSSLANLSATTFSSWRIWGRKNHPAWGEALDSSRHLDNLHWMWDLFEPIEEKKKKHPQEALSISILIFSVELIASVGPEQVWIIVPPWSRISPPMLALLDSCNRFISNLRLIKPKGGGGQNGECLTRLDFHLKHSIQHIHSVGHVLLVSSC